MTVPSYAATGFPDGTRQVTAGAPASLPAYAPAGMLNRHDPNTSTYNANDATLRRFRLALARTTAGVSSTVIVSTGDSSGGGYNGGTYNSALAMPRQMALTIAAEMGLPFFDGISPANAGSGINERWTISGGGGSSVTTTGNNFLTLTAAGYVEHTSSPGTAVDFYYSDLSTSGGVTWSVDGVSQGAVTTGGTATYQKKTATGLPYGVHTIRATWVSGTVYVGGAWGYTPGLIGVYHHNLCLGGATANVGTAFYNWSDTTAQGLKASHVGMFNLATSSATPDLHTIQIGGNDFNTSPGPTSPNNANTIAGIVTMKGFFPSTDTVSIGAYSPTATNPTGWDDLSQRRYQLADTANHVHFDWNSLAGGRAGIVANSAMGADSVHAKHEVNVHAGRVLGETLSYGPGATGSRLTVQLVSSTVQTAAPWIWYRADPTAAAFPINLPATPDDGAVIRIDNTASSGTNAITINRGGSDTLEGATSVTIAPGERGQFTYKASTGTWYMERHLASANPGTTARRGNDANIGVGTATLGPHATNKDYVRTRGYVRPHTAPTGMLMFPPNVVTLATGAPSTGRASFVPIDVGPDDARVFKALSVNVTTAQSGGTGTLVKGAIYADDGTGAAPLLTSTGLLTQVTFTVTSTGIKLIAPSTTTITLQPGRYWLCSFYYQGTSAPTTVPQFSVISSAASLWSLSTTFMNSRYLVVTGLTDLPTASQTLVPQADSTCIALALQAN